MNAQSGTVRPAECPPADPVLVTGGSGFFGTILIEQLLVRGWRARNFDLNAMDEPPADVEFFLGLSGKARFWTDDEIVEGRAGTRASQEPRGAPHMIER